MEPCAWPPFGRRREKSEVYSRPPPKSLIQNGMESLRPVGPYRSLRIAQISLAKSDRCSGVVACTVAVAALTSPAMSPRKILTLEMYWPNDCAPGWRGLYWRVNLPRPARLRMCPQRTLQLRHVQMRFSGAVFSSWPSRWPTSTFRSEPQNAQIRGPGGGHALARYLRARSVTLAFPRSSVQAGLLLRLEEIVTMRSSFACSSALYSRASYLSAITRERALRSRSRTRAVFTVHARHTDLATTRLLPHSRSSSFFLSADHYRDQKQAAREQ